MAIDFFHSEKILRLTPLAKDTEAVADSMLAGDVRVFPKLPNVQVRSLSQLWEMKFDSAPSTYALYVYALYPVSYLLNAYEATGRSGYLNKALKLAVSFLSWEMKGGKRINKKRERILFGDHATSNRTQVLCYLACCLNNEDRKINQDIKAALLRNGEYLADAENYSHYNHGLMMDLALLGLLNTFEGLEIDHPPHLKESLMARLQHSITRDLTEDGVHIENSPGYHFWMLGFLGKITPALKALDTDLHFKAKDALSKASVYAKYITRPDGSVPAIGDTHAGVKYKPSTGLESKLFEKSNQVVFRSPDDEIWAHFSSGYKTHVHKHCDNGAFNLFYKGKDFLVDPGFLSYENDKQSKDIRSTRFHNTVAPVGGEQEIEIVDISGVAGKEVSYCDSISKSRVVAFHKQAEYEYSIGVVSDYKDATIARLVLWVKDCGFIIYDKSIDGGLLGLEQYYNVGQNIEVSESDKSVILNGGGVSIEIQAIDVRENLNQDISIQEGFLAKAFGEKKSSKRVVVKSLGSECLTKIVFSQSSPVSVVGTQVSFSRLNKIFRIDLDEVLDGCLSDYKSERGTVFEEVEGAILDLPFGEEKKKS